MTRLGIPSDKATPSFKFTLVVGAALAFGVWIISPRFAIDGPSLVDDWAAISKSGRLLRNVPELFNPSGVRFRPGWILWNYLQWNTFDAPKGMLGPDAWAVARLVLFVFGLAAAAMLLVGDTKTSRSELGKVILAVLAPLAILAAPGTAVDFARFGPQEPVLVGGMALGGALLYSAATGIAQPGRLSIFRTTVKLGVGYSLWVLGVYQKEISVCALVLLPFLVLALRADQTSAFRRGSRNRSYVLLALAVAIVLPLAHVAVEVSRIVHRGQLVYGATARPDSAHQTLDALRRMPTLMGSSVGYVALLITTLGVGVSLLRRKPDWIQIGLLSTALTALAWSAQTDVFVSRYYIPTTALLAMASARASLSFSAALRYITVAVLMFAALSPAIWAHRSVVVWASKERMAVDLVRTTRSLEKSGCPIVVTGLDPERAVSLPVLVDLRRPSRGLCASRRVYVVAGPHADSGVLAACRKRSTIGTYTMAENGGDVSVSRCDLLEVGPRGLDHAKIL